MQDIMFCTCLGYFIMSLISLIKVIKRAREIPFEEDNEYLKSGFLWCAYSVGLYWTGYFYTHGQQTTIVIWAIISILLMIFGIKCLFFSKSTKSKGDQL